MWLQWKVEEVHVWVTVHPSDLDEWVDCLVCDTCSMFLQRSRRLVNIYISRMELAGVWDTDKTLLAAKSMTANYSDIERIFRQ